MDKETFVAQMDAKATMLYRVARSILSRDEDCKDALQACILRAWSARHTLRQPEYFGTWIVRILIHECHTLQRKQAKYSLAAEVPMGANAPAPDADVQAALTALPEKLRLPTVLHYIEGYSLAEISSILHVPQSTVRGRLYQARKALRLELDPKREVCTHETK